MTSPELTVVRQDGATRGRYVIDLGDGFEAEMNYTKPRDGVLSIHHTGVPSEFEGRGIAAKLVNAAIDDARAQGNKIEPLCSYVAAQFRRHREWSDLLA